MEWGEFNAPCADAFKDGLEGDVLKLCVDLFGHILGLVGKIVEWDCGEVVFVALGFAEGVGGHGEYDVPQKGAKSSTIGIVTCIFEDAHKA